MSSGDPVYYRIYLTRDNKLTVVCMQSFDEYDYETNKFLKDKSGERMLFKEEGEAVTYLNNNFKPEHIDPEYLSPNNEFFRKEVHR